MLGLYRWGLKYSAPVLKHILRQRLKAGKEDSVRLHERTGQPQMPRPAGKLLWLHAASVGEAQSALILINAVLKEAPNLKILVTTGTVTSATQMTENLPQNAFHQYIPLDHPSWVKSFMDHWQPDAVFWMESEFWPNMLAEVKTRNIPAALVNGRLSDRSYRRWGLLKAGFKKSLQVFDIISTQTDLDAKRFKAIGAQNVIKSGNLKYSAAPLSYDESDFESLQTAINNRPVIAYASTHKGEEAMAMRIHQRLEPIYPGLLSIIIPRHPQRGDEIAALGPVTLRGAEKHLPDADTKIYVADTMGELGLFYRLANIVYIGRSMSDDGGGGHNPIEAAQLDCAILHGPNIQNLQEIYDGMREAGIAVQNEEELYAQCDECLKNPSKVEKYAQRAINFASEKTHIIDRVLEHLQPIVAGLKT